MSEEVKIPLPRSLQDIVGALLFASETPLTALELRDAVRAVEPEEGENAEVMEVYRTCTTREVDAAIKGLGKALDVAGCGFSLVCTGGTYRLQTLPSCGRYVRAMLKMDRPSRLGRASLETLAIVAYRQPLTKSEIEEIRGVDVSGNLKTLMDLQLVRLVGKSELPGHPFLYGTTPLFLEHFGLSNLQQLNELDPTLQRSNPRLKASAYKRPETKKTELEQAAEAAKAEEPADAKPTAADAAEDGEAVPADGVAGGGDESAAAGGDGVQLPGDDGDLLAGDDEVLVDDTPDEFDDDDDDDEEDEEGEGEGKESGGEET